MRSALLFFLFLFLFTSARSEQSNLMAQRTADSAIAILLRQPEIIMDCVCCPDDTIRRVKPLKADVGCDGEPYCWITFEGVQISSGKPWAGQLDLAHVFVNINGTGVALSDHLGLRGNSCQLPFDWKTGKTQAQTFGMSSGPAQLKRFRNAFDSLGTMLKTMQPFEAYDIYTYLTVVCRDASAHLNFEDAALELSRTQGENSYRYTLPLGYGAKASLSERGIKLQAAYGKEILVEEYYEGILSKRYAINVIEFNFPEAQSGRASRWINTLNETFTYVPYTPEPATPGPLKKLVISSADSLLKAFTSNTHVVLRNGTYDLAGIASINVLENFMLEGEDSVRLVCSDNSRLIFQDCKNVTLRNLAMSYAFETESYPAKSVLEISHCSYFKIDNCRIGEEKRNAFMSGAAALTLEYTKYFSCGKSTLQGGRGGLAILEGCRHAQIESCVLRGALEGNTITLNNCSDVRFTKCTFRDNENSEYTDTPYFFAFDYNSAPLTLEQCDLLNNKVVRLTNDIQKLNRKENRFSGNTFADVKDEEMTDRK